MEYAHQGISPSESQFCGEREREGGGSRVDLLLRISARNSDLTCRLLKVRRAEDFLKTKAKENP